jgi:hypothetical protein
VAEHSRSKRNRSTSAKDQGWGLRPEQLEQAQRGRADDLDAARKLAAWLRAGGLPPAVANAHFVLWPGERLITHLPIDVWAYSGEDVQYRGGGVAFGGTFMFAATLLGSALLNSSRRAAAEQAAAPQWRPYGPGLIYVTDIRLSLALQQEWLDLEYRTIRALDSDGDSILIVVPNLPPTKLRLWRPYTHLVLIRFLMTGQILSMESSWSPG